MLHHAVMQLQKLEKPKQAWKTNEAEKWELRFAWK